MSYTKDVKARIHRYFRDNPDTILWRKDIAEKLNMTIDQVRNSAYALVEDGTLELIERAHAWRYNTPTATIDITPTRPSTDGTLYVIRQLKGNALVCIDDDGNLYIARKVSES